jgi:hypothetical protein
VGRTCGTNEEKRNVYRLLVGKPEGKRPLGRPRRRWIDNIKLNHVALGWGYANGVGLAQDTDNWRAVVNAVMNFRVPLIASKLLSGCTTVSSRVALISVTLNLIRQCVKATFS